MIALLEIVVGGTVGGFLLFFFYLKMYERKCQREKERMERELQEDHDEVPTAKEKPVVKEVVQAKGTTRTSTGWGLGRFALAIALLALTVVLIMRLNGYWSLHGYWPLSYKSTEWKDVQLLEGKTVIAVVTPTGSDYYLTPPPTPASCPYTTGICLGVRMGPKTYKILINHSQTEWVGDPRTNITAEQYVSNQGTFQMLVNAVRYLRTADPKTVCP